MKNKNFLIGILAITLVFGMMVAGCNGGSTDDIINDIVKKAISYTSVDSAGKTYILIITGEGTGNKGAKGDSYEMIIKENGQPDKVSKGTITEVGSNGGLKLQPGNSGSQPFDVTANNGQMTSITGTITVGEGEGQTVTAPGTVTPQVGNNNNNGEGGNGGKIMKEITYNANGILSSYHEYEYDSKGNRTKDRYYGVMINGVFICILIEYEYDSNGNQTKLSNYNADGVLSGYYKYEYDSKGNQTKVSNYNANGVLINYVYVYEYEYDSKGNQTKMSFYKDGVLSSYSMYEYDSKGNQTKQSAYTVDGVLSSYYEYEYDSKGNQTKESQHIGELFYDVYEYEYDSNGNRTKSTNYSNNKFSGYTVYSYTSGVVTGTSGDFFYYINMDGSISIYYSGDKEAVNINIPTQIVGKQVTVIRSGAFLNCFSLTSVTIPSSVTIIGDSAFNNCSKLTSVTFETGSNISDNNFGENVFGSNNLLKTAYSTGRAGTYTKANSKWTKQP